MDGLTDTGGSDGSWVEVGAESGHARATCGQDVWSELGHARKTCQRLLQHNQQLEEKVAKMEAVQKPLIGLLQELHNKIQSLQGDNSRLRAQLGRRDKPKLKMEASREQFPPPGHDAPYSPDDALFVTAKEGKESTKAKVFKSPEAKTETKPPENPPQVQPPDRKAFPSDWPSDLGSPPSALKELSIPVTYHCVIPRVIYRQQHVETAIALFYNYILGHDIPLKLQESRKLTLGMKPIPLLPVIASTGSLQKSIDAMFAKAAIPDGLNPIVLSFHFIAPHELQKRRRGFQSMEPQLPNCRAIINFVYFNKDFYDCECNNTGMAELVGLLQKITDQGNS